MEELPSIQLNLAGTSFEATPRNASLYMHLGHLAIYNHIFLITGSGEAPDSLLGTYLFDTGGDWFDEASQFMAETGFPMHVNLRTVADSDVAAYERMIAQNVTDLEEVPDWLRDEQT